MPKLTEAETDKMARHHFDVDRWDARVAAAVGEKRNAEARYQALTAALREKYGPIVHIDIETGEYRLAPEPKAE